MTRISNYQGKINKNSNYELWRSCMELYLIGNDLWKLICRKNTNTPIDFGETTKWNTKVDKAIYAFKLSKLLHNR